MPNLGLALCGVLSLIALLHVFWGLGGLWPGKDPQSLARTVVGAPNIRAMPPSAAAFAVALCLAFAAIIPLVLVREIKLPMMEGLFIPAGYVCLAVFLGRGLAAYISAFRRLFPEEPFATYDRWFYAPLCLAIAAGFAFILDYALNLRCGTCG